MPDIGVDPLDEHRDPGDVARIRRLASEVAADFGVDLSGMRRANGCSNATWVGGGIAVRISQSAAGMDHEADLVQALPQEVGHPQILEQVRPKGTGGS